MRTYLDICDMKTPQKHDEHGENCENIIFSLLFNFFFKIFAINGTETLGMRPQLVAELSRGCP